MQLVIYGVIVLSILIFIHELGHFLAAKALKIPVLSFSICFGKPIFKIKWGETEYRLSPIPFGGYVSMEGENPNQGTKNGFSSRPVWQRAVVALGGPLFNLISSFIFLWIMFFTGVPHAPYQDSTVVGAVADSTPAYSKIIVGDSIVSVNSKPVDDWRELHTALNDLSGSYDISFFRDNIKMSVHLDIAPPNPKTLQSVGSGLYPSFPPIVGEISEGSPAQIAGITAGDTIIAINGQPISSWYRIIEEVTNFKDDSTTPLLLTLKNIETKNLNITPKFDKTLERNLIGIKVASATTEIRKYSISESFQRAWDKTIEYSVLIFKTLGKLIRGEISFKLMSGPLGITQMAGAAVKSGLADTLNLLALIGINLGLINLMPLVITDGGILSLLIIEVIRKKPISEALREKLSYVFAGAFIILFVFVTFSDIFRFMALNKLLN